MKTARFVRHLSVALATFGLVLPQAGMAKDTLAPKVIDVSLSDNGVLHGQVVDGNGTSRPSATVTLHQGSNQVAVTNTNAKGEFAVSGLKGGMYTVSTTGVTGVVRAWSPRTAPPSAVNGVLLVPDSQTARAQFDGEFVDQFGLAALGLGAFAAVVIGVAVHHNEGS